MAQLRFSTTPHSRFPAPATSTAVIRFSGRHGSIHFPADSALNSVHPAVGISLNLSPPLRIGVRPLVRTTTGDGAGTTVGGGGGSGGGRRKNGGGGGGGGGAGHSREEGNGKSDTGGGILGLFLEGWRSRVRADPQFPFKVLMEELVGVSANVIGDMATRPNFGLNELDFVFSTLVVGSIVNFLLMYLLAPTAGAVSASAASNPFASIFAACPKSHMFEPGPYSLLHRSGTFICKGVVFAAVGFAAGMLGTAISNALISWRKRMDPGFEPQNKAPPTVLNALTWAIHLGVSSNLRYQTLNGLEFMLARALPPLGFGASVVALRCANNLLGGATFVVLARLTGSQKVEEEKAEVIEVLQDNCDGETHKDQQD
ncbi:protein RETICULATA-RELATED 3, chloroplastic-like [Nymphaea colorata]|uniref:Protein RETICULATA-RELATED 3, chloroplastic n=1 Tax=Nymphaea colorata TaxID=210225 RepID=A0A5K0W423_9MAGN|nr:protein RETICULATA-RELATED 3, chloroplastic-like [Nymphaea colorata]